MALTITVNGVPYPVPSSGADQDWGAKQVAFLQALAAATNTAIADAAAATAAAAAATSAAAAATADAAAALAAAAPSDVVMAPGVAGTPSTHYGRTVVHKVTINYPDLSDVSNTKTIVVGQLPARTRSIRVIADITEVFASGSLTALHLSVGNPLSTDEDFLASFRGDLSATQFGTAAAELGEGIVGSPAFDDDLRAWSSTDDVRLTAVCDGDTLDALTAGSVTLYIECCTYPP